MRWISLAQYVLRLPGLSTSQIAHALYCASHQSQQSLQYQRGGSPQGSHNAHWLQWKQYVFWWPLGMAPRKLGLSPMAAMASGGKEGELAVVGWGVFGGWLVLVGWWSRLYG